MLALEMKKMAVAMNPQRPGRTAAVGPRTYGDPARGSASHQPAVLGHRVQRNLLQSQPSRARNYRPKARRAANTNSPDSRKPSGTTTASERGLSRRD
jgi:hypothetical protein